MSELWLHGDFFFFFNNIMWNYESRLHGDVVHFNSVHDAMLNGRTCRLEE